MQCLQDRANADEHIVHALLVTLLRLVDLHLIERYLPGRDLLGKILDVEFSLFVHEADYIEE